MTEERGPNIPNIRKLLETGFNTDELRAAVTDITDFHDLLPVLKPGDSTSKIADDIISFALRRTKFKPLLRWAKDKNPDKYELCKPYNITSDVSSEQTSADRSPSQFGSEEENISPISSTQATAPKAQPPSQFGSDNEEIGHHTSSQDELIGLNKIFWSNRLLWAFIISIAIVFAIGIVIRIVIGANMTKSPIQTVEKATEDTIESLSSELFTVNGLYDPEFRSGTGRIVITKVADQDYDYGFEYRLSENQAGYAGFAFKFEPPLDVLQYTTLAVTLTRNDKDANCQINLKVGKKASYITICDASFEGGKEVKLDSNISEGEFTVFIPLRLNFDDIDREKVEELGISASDSITTGDHFFIIHKIEFLREETLANNRR